MGITLLQAWGLQPTQLGLPDRCPTEAFCMHGLVKHDRSALEFKFYAEAHTPQQSVWMMISAQSPKAACSSGRSSSRLAPLPSCLRCSSMRRGRWRWLRARSSAAMAERPRPALSPPAISVPVPLSTKVPRPTQLLIASCTALRARTERKHHTR